MYKHLFSIRYLYYINLSLIITVTIFHTDVFFYDFQSYSIVRYVLLAASIILYNLFHKYDICLSVYYEYRQYLFVLLLFMLFHHQVFGNLTFVYSGDIISNVTIIRFPTLAFLHVICFSSFI